MTVHLAIILTAIFFRIFSDNVLFQSARLCYEGVSVFSQFNAVILNKLLISCYLQSQGVLSKVEQPHLADRKYCEHYEEIRAGGARRNRC